MLSSEVAICNLSLSWLAGNRITSLDGSSVEAELCKDNYAAARDATLELVDWTFASARRAPARDAAAPAFGWDYSFTLPPDCLVVRQVSDEPDFIHGIDYIREGNKLMTNVSTVYIRYTRRVEDVLKFSSLFSHALASHLAANISIPLTHSEKMENKMLKKLQFYLDKAAGHDGSQGSTQVLRSTKLTGVR